MTATITTLTTIARLRIFSSLLAVLLIGLSSTVSYAVSISWDGGGGANQNWGQFLNFSDDMDPSGDDVTFNDTAEAGSAGVVTNIVDSSVSIGDFIMTNAIDGAGSFHTTQIDLGQTLTIMGNYEQGINGCVASGSCAGDDTHMTFTGAGTLTFNNSGGQFEVGQWNGSYNKGARQVTLDMANLATFNMDADVWQIGWVGAASPATVMTLADTNDLTASVLDIAHWNDTAVLELGRVNTLNIDTFDLSYDAVNAATSTIRFDSGLVNPSVVIRDAAGTGPATLLMSKQSQSNTSSTLDFTGGNVDAQFDAIEMGFGRPNQYAGNANATITFDDGMITANTMLMAQIRDRGNATATVNINGTAVFEATTITMGDIIDNNSNGYTGIGTARFNIAGGTFRATTIQPGAQLGDVVQPHVREINFVEGTFGNRAGGDLSVAAEIPIHIFNATTHTFDITAGQTAAIHSDIDGSGTGDVIKAGDGTLLMLGNNTYSAPTIVNAGVLGGTGSSMSDVTVSPGGSVAPGASAGTFNAADFDLQSGATLEIELGGLVAGTDYDQLIPTGNVTLDGQLVVSFINGFYPDETDVFTIINGGSILGEFSGVDVVGTNGFFDVLYSGSQVQLTNFQVPEPSTFALVGVALAGLAVVRRRRRRA